MLSGTTSKRLPSESVIFKAPEIHFEQAASGREQAAGMLLPRRNRRQCGDGDGDAFS